MPSELSDLTRAGNALYEFIRHLRFVLSQTPLEIVAAVINHHEHLRPVGLRLFSAYDDFLAALSDPATRNHLDTLLPDNQEQDSVYQDLRGVSHKFRDAVLDLFFDGETRLNRLAGTYGIF